MGRQIHYRNLCGNCDRKIQDYVCVECPRRAPAMQTNPRDKKTVAAARAPAGMSRGPRDWARKVRQLMVRVRREYHRDKDKILTQFAGRRGEKRELSPRWEG